MTNNINGDSIPAMYQSSLLFTLKKAILSKVKYMYYTDYYSKTYHVHIIYSIMASQVKKKINRNWQTLVLSLVHAKFVIRCQYCGNCLTAVDV